MRFSICLIEPDGYKYSHFLYDSCKYLCYTIESNGYDCCMVRNTFYSDRINIILGSHNIIDPAVAKQIESAGLYVIVQSELLRDGGITGWPNQSSFTKIYIPLMRRATAVWDGIELNKRFIEKLGFEAEYIPRFGYLPTMEEITHKKRKDIDFLYYGSLTPHRKKKIDELKARGANIVCFFDEAAIFRNDYIARTRVHLSPMQGPGADQIPTRLLYLLNNRCVVVSEKCRNQDWVEQCFLSADTDLWVDLCMETLHRPDLEQLGDQFFERYKQLDMTALFQPLLDNLYKKIYGVSQNVSMATAVDRLQYLVSKSDKSIKDKAHTKIPEPCARLEALLKEPKEVASIDTFAGAKFQETSLATAQSITSMPQFSEKAIPDMTSIIILTHNRLELTKKCLKSIRKHTPETHEIIFVDNGSTDSTIKWLQGQARENKNYRLIENRENQGIATGRNQGINLSRGEFITLMDNDVIVGPDWLSGMSDCLHYAPDAGIIGPMTNSTQGLQQTSDISYLSLEHLDKAVEQFKMRYSHRRIPCRNLSGFCMLMKRSMLENIGLLDERFESGHFAAEDLCWRTSLAGLNSFIAGDVFIHHAGKKEAPGDRSILNNKWTLSLADPQGKKLAVLKTVELANDLYFKGNMDQAIEALVNCIKLTPEDAEIYYHLTRFFIESKRFSEAWEVIGAMPDAAKNELKGLEFAGYTKEGLGLDDEAADYVDKMLSRDDKYPAALNLQGVLAYKKGDKEKAQVYFQKASDADPGYGEAYTNLGVLYWSMDKNEEALQNLQKGFMLTPTVPDVRSLYYSVISSLGIFDSAEADYREASRLYPNNKDIAFLSIDIFIQQGKFPEALIQIQDVLGSYGLDDGIMTAALAVREKIGPLQIEKASQKGTLSLCMIVKNEEKYLLQCLKSVRDIVDEMIIVDTGSTDKTVDIARIFGAKIYDFPWTGDFAAARNESMKYATGNWILILDGDEVLSPLDFKELKELIHKKSSSPAAYTIATRNYITNVSIIGWVKNTGEYPEEAGTGWVVSKKVRLLTRSRNVAFMNPVHETLEASLAKAGIPVRPCNIVVHHYGKLDVQKDLKKGEDYYLLGKIKYENDPTNTKYILELARQAQALGKHEEAIGLWLELITLFQKAKPDSIDYQNVAQSTHGDPLAEIYTQIASAYLSLDRYADALAAARKAMTGKTRQKEYVHVYAHCEIIAGLLTNALGELEELLKATPDYLPALILMTAIFCLEGRKEEAQQCISLFQKKNVIITPVMNTYARQLRNHGKKDDALLIINAMIESKLNDAETNRILE